jgi:hypothetical protein
MFAVLIRLDNHGDLLKPGMNAEVQIQIANRESVAAVPTMALRADSDIPTAALMLGMTEPDLREMLSVGAEGDKDGASRQSAERASQLPDGIDMSQMQPIIAKRRNGETLTAQEQALVDRLQARMQQSGGGFGGGRGGGTGGGMGGGRAAAGVSTTDYQFGGDYWVVTMKDGEVMPVSVKTGLTDLEYSEIVSGLDTDAEVLLLPSSSLFEQQETIQSFISARFGSATPFQQSTGPGTGGGRGGPR